MLLYMYWYATAFEGGMDTSFFGPATGMNITSMLDPVVCPLCFGRCHACGGRSSGRALFIVAEYAVGYVVGCGRLGFMGYDATSPLRASEGRLGRSPRRARSPAGAR